MIKHPPAMRLARLKGGASLLAGRLPKGVRQYVYYARAMAPGDFFVAPAHAEEIDFPEVFGRSDSGRFAVRVPE